MQLTSAHICNFRSIRDVQIAFDPACLILAGINESGKSNVLKALSTLGDDYQLTIEDVRESAPDDVQPVKEAFIKFYFELTSAEIEVVFKDIEQHFHQKKNAPLIFSGGKELDLRSFVMPRGSGVYHVDLIERKKVARYFSLSGNMKICPNWFLYVAEAPLDVDGRTIEEGDLIYSLDFPALEEGTMTMATVDDVARFVGARIATYIRKNLPETLLWQYKEANLLPSSINLDSFAQNPDSCVPLKNMFVLAGVGDIARAIASTKGMSRNAIENFFSRVAHKTTEHFRSVWKEHKSIQFELRPDGDHLIPGVREKNVFDFAKRSDGFKRFVSFLLLISASVRSGTISDTLLLVDEPDISLHPSGARFLRDELVRISDTNLVVYSTHSIFMIDRERVERHLIVSKQGEETRVAVANDSNMFAEEVIYNAIGYSIFEVMKQRNLIFEGWKDKHLFRTAMKKVPPSHAGLREALKDVGLCHARGVKQIKAISPLIELADRQCVIVTDGDVPAKQRQADYVSERGYGVWKRYDELLEHPFEHMTAEDFIKPSAFKPALKEICARHPNLSACSEEELSANTAKLKTLDRWLARGGLNPVDRKEELDALKNKVFENLKPSDIEASYFDLLNAIVVVLEEQGQGLKEMLPCVQEAAN